MLDVMFVNFVVLIMQKSACGLNADTSLSCLLFTLCILINTTACLNMRK